MNRAPGDKISGKNREKFLRLKFRKEQRIFKNQYIVFACSFLENLSTEFFDFFCPLQNRSKLLRKKISGKNNEPILTYLQKCKKMSKNRDFFAFLNFSNEPLIVFARKVFREQFGSVSDRTLKIKKIYRANMENHSCQI